MTCLEVVERGAYGAGDSPTLADALSALTDAGASWDSLPDGGNEMCAAADLAVTLWALSDSPKLALVRRCQIARALDAVKFRPSPLWRSPRHAFSDMPELRRAFFVLRDSARS